MAKPRTTSIDHPSSFLRIKQATINNFVDVASTTSTFVLNNPGRSTARIQVAVFPPRAYLYLVPSFNQVWEGLRKYSPNEDLKRHASESDELGKKEGKKQQRLEHQYPCWNRSRLWNRWIYMAISCTVSSMSGVTKRICLGLALSNFFDGGFLVGRPIKYLIRRNICDQRPYSSSGIASQPRRRRSGRGRQFNCRVNLPDPMRTGDSLYLVRRRLGFGTG